MPRSQLFTAADPVNWLRLALCFVTEFAFTRGWRYSFDREPVPMAIQIISSNVSVTAWGIAWFAAAALAAASIPKAWPGGSILVISLSLAFALGFTLSWVSAWNGPRETPGFGDYNGAGTYWFSFGVLVCGYFGFVRALDRTKT